jgi:hypothetical protein
MQLPHILQLASGTHGATYTSPQSTWHTNKAVKAVTQRTFNQLLASDKAENVVHHGCVGI